MRPAPTPRVSAVARPRGWGNTPEGPSGCFGCKPASPLHLPVAPVATDAVQHSSVTLATAVTVVPWPAPRRAAWGQRAGACLQARACPLQHSGTDRQ
eukprot:9390022-Pyramimonas_sp.AAC.1